MAYKVGRHNLSSSTQFHSANNNNNSVRPVQFCERSLKHIGRERERELRIHLLHGISVINVI